MVVRGTELRPFGMAGLTLSACFNATAVSLSWEWENTGTGRFATSSLSPDYSLHITGEDNSTSGRIAPWLCSSAMTDGPSASG